MATKTVLALTDKEKSSISTKKESERIVMLEERPSPDWFVKVKTADGKAHWFVRVSVTGLCVRRYGPFPSKRACLLFLDSAVNAMIDGIMGLSDVQDRYRIPDGAFRNRGGHYPIIERELILHAPTVKPRNILRHTARTTHKHGIRGLAQRARVQ